MLALFALVVSATSPQVACAQQEGGHDPGGNGLVRETEDDLRARLDSLRPLLENARLALEARNARAEEANRRAAAAVARVDTFTIGGATVLTPLEQSGRTRELFAKVWEERFARLGHSPALARSLFVFQWSDRTVPIHVDGEAHVIDLDGWTPRARVDDAIATTLASAMRYDLPEEQASVARWGVANPLTPPPMELVHRIVATTHSRVTRGCLGGDAEACASAMALGTTTDLAQLREWYTPQERRSLVATSFARMSRIRADARRRCVERSELAVCDRMLLDYSRDWAPLGGDVRASLLAYAIERGGPGAWDRLIEHPGMTRVEAMEHAAGMPMSEILAGWQARLVAARPEVYEGLVPKSGLALVWTLFFAALAMRSTRWRLG